MRRFWHETQIMRVAEGFEVALDGKPIRTPGKAALVLPNMAVAEAMRDEWDAQASDVDPRAMPVTRAANTAIDRVVPNAVAVVGEITAFGETDLLCYREPKPAALAARQAEGWDPLLDWAAGRYGARLTPSNGVMFSAQDGGAVAALHDAVAGFDAWRLTALHELVTLTGSLVLGLAIAERRLAAAEGWRLSRIDEDWNIEEWGKDAEAAAAAAVRERALYDAARLMALLEDE
ncbi:MAG: ATP12 family protein [Pseudomonadota bacterium]